MKVLVWGAGAIGGTLAAHFARAGHEVVCVDVVEEHVRAIAERGLHVTGPLDDFVARPEARTPGGLAGEFGVALLGVKSKDTEDAAAAIARHLRPDGYVASFQNGLNELVIADIVGRRRTVGAFINFAAEYVEPGVVFHGGRGAVVVGELDGARTARIEALHRLCLAFDEGALLSPDIMSYLWGKLIYGGVLRITAVADLSIADGLAAPAARPLFVGLAREILTVADAEGISLHGFNGFEPDAFRPGAAPGALGRTFDAMVRFNRGSASATRLVKGAGPAGRGAGLDPTPGAVYGAGREPSDGEQDDPHPERGLGGGVGRADEVPRVPARDRRRRHG